MVNDDARSSPVDSDGGVDFFSAPASFAQQRIWFVDRFQTALAVYNISLAWRVAGRLQVTSLHHALKDLVSRHEILRTTLAAGGATPVQVVASRGSVPFTVEDLPSCTHIDDHVHAIALEEAEAPFDLATGPLIRTRLVRITDDDYLFSLTIHHAISDMISLGILTAEIQVLYAAHLDGSQVDLPPLEIQYADYSVWQRDRLQGDERDRLLAFWGNYLDGAPQVLSLPTDRPPPMTLSFRGDWVDIQMDRTQTGSLLRLSERSCATLFMTMAALFNVLIYRTSAQCEFLVGYPITGRDRPELEKMIGLFVNTLVIRARLHARMTFSEVIASVRDDVLDAHEHRDLPFELLIESMKPDRNPSQHPLFQVAFTLASGEAGKLELSGAEVTPIRILPRTSKFDLTLYLTESSDGLISGGLEYSSDLFDRATMEVWAQRLIRLVDAVIATPDAPIWQLDILSTRERSELITSWSPVMGLHSTRLVHEQVKHHCRERPDSIAIIAHDLCLSYGTLDIRAEALAHRLVEKGVGRGSIVGLCIERSEHLPVGMLGVLKAGAAYLPFEPDLPPARISYMAEETGVTVVITTSQSAPSLAEVSCVATVMVDDEEPTHFSSVESNVCSHDLAYLIYTSGSSGSPKPVAIPHGGLCSLVSWHREFHGIRPSDCCSQMANIGFDACTWEVLACLTVGATLVVVDDATRSNSSRLWDFLSKHQITHAFVPTLLAEKLLADPSGIPSQVALRTLLTGGDRLHYLSMQKLPFAVVNHYGPTEATVVATAGKVDGVDPHRLPSIGRPIPTARIYILDTFGEPVPSGTPGEMYIGGDGVALGYWGRPALTAERFVPDPIGDVPGSRLFKTGDLARYCKDGRIEFLGRLDRQIQLRGQRLEPGEIEVVLGKFPLLGRCVVELIESSSGEQKLVAFVETTVTAEEGSISWRRHLERSLPQYMIPSTFVSVERLPLLSSGKIDRQALLSIGSTIIGNKQGLVSPRTSFERQLADLWCELLGLDSVGIHDNLFSLGAHSLLVIQFVGLAQTLGVELEVRDVFQHPTVADLHDHLTRSRELDSNIIDDHLEFELGEV